MKKSIPVTRSSLPPFEEYCAEIQSLWDSRILTNQGEKHRKLEEELASLTGAKNLILFTNGHLALEYAIEAMGLKGEIITTPYTFASTTQAIVRCGCTPVFCDIDPVNFTLDPAKIEALITPQTVAILPVHVYGNICDVEAIKALADRYRLKVIYDAAHAIGERYKGQGSGSFGDASMFSFHATKVFHTIEGGGLAFPDDSLREKINAMKNFGQINPETLPYLGGNGKMSEFQAAMGLCNLRYLDENIRRRKVAALRYLRNLSGIPGLGLSFSDNRVEYNYAYFPVIFDGFKWDRDAVFDRFTREGITPRKYFYPLTSSFAAYQGRFPIGETPIAKRIADTVLTLPLYAELENEDVDRICELIVTA